MEGFVIFGLMLLSAAIGMMGGEIIAFRINRDYGGKRKEEEEIPPPSEEEKTGPMSLRNGMGVTRCENPTLAEQLVNIMNYSGENQKEGDYEEGED